MKFLLSVLIILGSIASFIFYVNPTYKEIKALKVESEEYNKALKEAESARTHWDETIRRYNDISTADIERLEKFLPDTIDNIRLLLDINEIALGYGTRLGGITIQRVASADPNAIGADNKPYGSLAVAFTVNTTYDVLTEFLKDLEQSLRIADVSILSFQAGVGSVNTYEISLRTYWLK